jgi:hypothetical protein
VRRVARQFVKRGGNQALHPRITKAAWRTRARFVKQTVYTPLHKPTAPLAHCLNGNPKAVRDLGVGFFLSAPQNNSRAQCQRLRSLVTPGPLNQLIVLGHAQNQFRQRPPSFHILSVDAHYSVRQRSEHIV